MWMWMWNSTAEDHNNDDNNGGERFSTVHPDRAHKQMKRLSIYLSIHLSISTTTPHAAPARTPGRKRKSMEAMDGWMDG